MKQRSKENWVFELEKNNQGALLAMSHPILLASSLFVGICLYLSLYCRRALKYLQPWCFLVRIRGFGLRLKKYFIVPIFEKAQIYKSQNTMKLKYISLCITFFKPKAFPLYLGRNGKDQRKQKQASHHVVVFIHL